MPDVVTVPPKLVFHDGDVAEEDKQGEEGVWLDVPPISQFTTRNRSNKWCGRTTGSMIWNYVAACLKASTEKANRIRISHYECDCPSDAERENWQKGRNNLRYVADVPKGSLHGNPPLPAKDIEAGRTVGGAATTVGWMFGEGRFRGVNLLPVPVPNLNVPGAERGAALRRKAVQSADKLTYEELREAFAPVIDALDRGLPVIQSNSFYGNNQHRSYGGHFVVCTGWRRYQGTLWMRYTDPAGSPRVRGTGAGGWATKEQLHLVTPNAGVRAQAEGGVTEFWVDARALLTPWFQSDYDQMARHLHAEDAQFKGSNNMHTVAHFGGAPAGLEYILRIDHKDCGWGMAQIPDPPPGTPGLCVPPFFNRISGASTFLPLVGAHEPCPDLLDDVSWEHCLAETSQVAPDETKRPVGTYPVATGQTWHTGSHFTAPRMAPVYAVAEGRVVAARLGSPTESAADKRAPMRGFVLVEHASGEGRSLRRFWSLYMHTVAASQPTDAQLRPPWFARAGLVPSAPEKPDNRPKPAPKRVARPGTRIELGAYDGEKVVALRHSVPGTGSGRLELPFGQTVAATRELFADGATVALCEPPGEWSRTAGNILEHAWKNGERTVMLALPGDDDESWVSVGYGVGEAKNRRFRAQAADFAARKIAPVGEPFRGLTGRVREGDPLARQVTLGPVAAPDTVFVHVPVKKKDARTFEPGDEVELHEWEMPCFAFACVEEPAKPGFRQATVRRDRIPAPLAWKETWNGLCQLEPKQPGRLVVVKKGAAVVPTAPREVYPGVQGVLAKGRACVYDDEIPRWKPNLGTAAARLYGVVRLDDKLQYEGDGRYRLLHDVELRMTWQKPTGLPAETPCVTIAAGQVLPVVLRWQKSEQGPAWGFVELRAGVAQAALSEKSDAENRKDLAVAGQVELSVWAHAMDGLRRFVPPDNDGSLFVPTEALQSFAAEGGRWADVAREGHKPVSAGSGGLPAWVDPAAQQKLRERLKALKTAKVQLSFIAEGDTPVDLPLKGATREALVVAADELAPAPGPDFAYDVGSDLTLVWKRVTTERALAAGLPADWCVVNPGGEGTNSTAAAVKVSGGKYKWLSSLALRKDPLAPFRGLGADGEPYLETKMPRGLKLARVPWGKAEGSTEKALQDQARLLPEADFKPPEPAPGAKKKKKAGDARCAVVRLPLAVPLPLLENAGLLGCESPLARAEAGRTLLGWVKVGDRSWRPGRDTLWVNAVGEQPVYLCDLEADPPAAFHAPNNTRFAVRGLVDAEHAIVELALASPTPKSLDDDVAEAKEEEEKARRRAQDEKLVAEQAAREDEARRKAAWAGEVFCTKTPVGAGELLGFAGGAARDNRSFVHVEIFSDQNVLDDTGVPSAAGVLGPAGEFWFVPAGSIGEGPDSTLVEDLMAALCAAQQPDPPDDLVQLVKEQVDGFKQRLPPGRPPGFSDQFGDLVTRRMRPLLSKLVVQRPSEWVGPKPADVCSRMACTVDDEKMYFWNDKPGNLLKALEIWNATLGPAGTGSLPLRTEELKKGPDAAQKVTLPDPGSLLFYPPVQFIHWLANGVRVTFSKAKLDAMGAKDRGTTTALLQPSRMTSMPVVAMPTPPLRPVRLTAAKPGTSVVVHALPGAYQSPLQADKDLVLSGRIENLRFE